LDVGDFFFPKSVEEIADKFNGLCCAFGLFGYKIATSYRGMSRYIENGEQEERNSLIVSFHGSQGQYLFEFSFAHSARTKRILFMQIHFDEPLYYMKKVKKLIDKKKLNSSDGIIYIRGIQDLNVVFDFIKNNFET
jgi:hypothetical protein